MPTYKKRDFPVRKTRRFLEPGPIVLVSSRWKGATNIMTMGWHMMLDYALFGCYIWEENHSFEMIRRSRECVINVPTFDLLDKVIGIEPTTAPTLTNETVVPLKPKAEFGSNEIEAGAPLG